MRIASLLPSATEIVCGLGLRSQLVGVSHECDWPSEVAGTPVLTRSRIEAPGSSAAIDGRVRSAMQDALAIYEVDGAAMQKANPDLIVTQDLCEVCAVSYADVCAAVRELGNDQVEIVSLHPTVLADLWLDIERIGRATGREAEAARWIGGLKARLGDLEQRSSNLERRKILTIEWLDPVMIGGMWMPELVAVAGGECMLTAPGDYAPTLTGEQLAVLEPDVVLFKPCGFDLERSRDEIELMRTMASAAAWPACDTGDVYVADGNAYFNRSGPRLVESAEILAAILHPAEFGDLVDRHADAYERV